MRHVKTAEREGWRYRVTALVGIAALVAFVVGRADAPWAQAGGRVIYMAAVEMKGGAQQDKEPYPEEPLPPGSGYIKTPPNPSGRWEVSAYQWSPGTLVVKEGEAVTLEVVGINGDEHHGTIQDHVEAFTVKRGQLTRVRFTAGKPGIYAVICTKHLPNMQGTLLVLPK
jgi:hypothetical protein